MKSGTDARLIESTTTLYKDREIYPSVKDLQSTTRLAYFSPIPFNTDSCKKPLILLKKLLQNVFWS